jgi:hypothetical protein
MLRCDGDGDGDGDDDDDYDYDGGDNFKAVNLI